MGYGDPEVVPCIGCELGSEVWYSPWPGWGAAPGETPSAVYSNQDRIDAKTLIVLAIALYIMTR